MAKTTTTTVRFIYDAKGRVKERIEETVTTETVDVLPSPTGVQPYWYVPQIWCTATNTGTGATYIGAN